MGSQDPGITNFLIPDPGIRNHYLSPLQTCCTVTTHCITQPNIHNISGNQLSTTAG